MTVYAVLHIDSTTIDASANYEIAAFCNEECRGIASVETIESIGKTYYYLRVRSNVSNGETISFKCYDKNKQCELELDTTIEFNSQDMKGIPSKPFELIGAYKYRIEYFVDGKVLITEWVRCGDEITAPENPQREGYIFVEWNGLPKTMPSHDVETTAVYEPKILQITDSISINSFEQIEDAVYGIIHYTRTFKNDNWQALYVPFKIPFEKLKNDFEVARFNGTIDETTIMALKIKNGTLDQNTPYLIRAKETGYKTITIDDVTLYATRENSICYSNFTITGTYNRLSSNNLLQDEGYYALSAGKWQPIKEGASLGAFRFYLKIDGAIPTSAIRMRIISEDEEDDATLIDNSQLTEDNALQTYIYDLAGRRIEKPTKGIYIVNGKKVVIK